MIINWLIHYEKFSLPTWRKEFQAARTILEKYFLIKMDSNYILISTLLDPRYREGIFKKIQVPAGRINSIISLLMNECAQMVSQISLEYKSQGLQSGSNQFSEPDHYNLMRHLGQNPIETNVATPQSHKDEVLSYLQNLHQMSKG
ncbi:hypothetical protein O181_101594 [Austropuccinia psidii MF-1]|uniref:Uncharacterized protein n=1 Tax=Austropuccinia psidii MF-1 TaxID=1389203 RepID=A0A9Q3JHH6_9BASI|nr:hypothetical protein [Austropuccinia psidii MF-1]